MSAAGYDPEALVRYVSRVQPSSMRIADLQRVIEQLSSKTYSMENDLARIQTELRRLLPPAPRRPPSLLLPN